MSGAASRRKGHDTERKIARWLRGQAETVAGLVAIAREHDVRVDDATRGERDGWIIDADRAEAYASCRTWVEDDYGEAG